MIIEVHNRTSDFNSYRAARVKNLFNAENGCNFDLIADIDISGKWNIGVIVGPSGSGKTSLGKQIFSNLCEAQKPQVENPSEKQKVGEGGSFLFDLNQGWAKDKPIIDEIAPEGDFNEVTGALASVGLGDVPAWLRPFDVLSNGEKFRAALARLICEKPRRIVVDEFTSVIDRQIAQIGSNAFQKAWRRSNPDGQVVLLTPHYDILDWVQPDWVFDTKTKIFERGSLRQRPKIDIEIFKVNQSYWKFFKPHYYLDLPMPPCAEYFVGVANGELACHLAVTPLFTAKCYRATRLVTMPEWQGAGVGIKFLEWVCEYYKQGHGRCNKKFPTFFHTSHPQLCAALRRSNKWVQRSCNLYGGNKNCAKKSIIKSSSRKDPVTCGYGGHFRAIQGFKYIGLHGGMV